MAIQIGRITHVRVGGPRARHSENARGEWQTSFGKRPVDGPVWVGAEDLAGNQQADTSVHGGSERAVLFYALRNYEYWSELLSIPHTDAVARGFAENLTVEGIDEASVFIGDHLKIGDAIVEVGQPRSPCWKISEFWGVPDLTKRVLQTGKTGWFARVIAEGHVRAGDAVEVVQRNAHDVSVLDVNLLAFAMDTRRPVDRGVLERAAACVALAPNWRKYFASAL